MTWKFSGPCDDTATLIFLVDQAALTLHRWLSRVDDIDHPDRLVFDLDPYEDGNGDDFEAVREAARQLHALLYELGLPSAPMATGSRGVHVVGRGRSLGPAWSKLRSR